MRWLTNGRTTRGTPALPYTGNVSSASHVHPQRTRSHTQTHIRTSNQSREYKGEGTKFGRSPILHRHAEQAVRARINIAAGKAGQGMLPGLLKSMSLTPTPRQAAGCCALPSAAVSSTSGHGDSAAHAASPTHAASSAHASAWGSRASARPRSS